MQGVSVLLIALLAAAALLGGLIGYAFSRLSELSRQAVALQEAELKHEAAERESAARVDVLGTSLVREREVAARDKRRFSGRESAFAARQESLELHAVTQKNRVESLLAEQRAMEEKHMLLERQLVTVRQEFAMVERDRVMASPVRSASSSEAPPVASSNGSAGVVVPVLTRRVGARNGDKIRRATAVAERRSDSADPDFDSFSLEGDIPVLAEAELPDSIEFDDIVDER